MIDRVDSGWDVSEAMLVDMFGKKRVSAALSMLAGDLQRAFVVLLETDGLDDDDSIEVDDNEWDYEPPTSASQNMSAVVVCRLVKSCFEKRLHRYRPSFYFHYICRIWIYRR